MTDLYEALGVPRDADGVTINRAYRRAARRAHPDKGGSKAAFQRVEQAGRILRDPQRRLAYDTTGAAGESADNAPLTEEQQATSLLKQLFIKVLDHSIAKGGDPIALLRDEIRKGIAEAPGIIAAQRRKITKLEKALAKHLKGHAASPPHLEQALTAHIHMQKQVLTSMELTSRIGQIMLKLLEVYSWEEEQPAYKQQQVNTFINNYFRDIGAL